MQSTAEPMAPSEIRNKNFVEDVIVYILISYPFDWSIPRVLYAPFEFELIPTSYATIYVINWIGIPGPVFFFSLHLRLLLLKFFQFFRSLIGNLKQELC